MDSLDIFPAAVAIPCASRADWLEKRRLGIGASDSPAIVGWDRGKRLTPAAWRGPLEIYADKIGKGIDHSSNAMEWGHRFENAIRERFADGNPGLKIENPGMTIYRNKETPFLQATLDGIILENSAPGILEIKTSRRDWGDEVPIYYQVQVQHQLLVTGAPWGIIAALFWGSEYRVEYREYPRILADPEWAAIILRDCSSFWDRVQRRDPPIETLAPKRE